MKRIIIIICILSSTLLVNSQSLKEILGNYNETDRFSNMMKLREFQAFYPNRALTYFFLGNIHSQYMMEMDPLLMFSSLETEFHEAKVYFSLALLKLDDKQASQDRNYFGEIRKISDKKKPGLADLQNEINQRVDDLTDYYEKAKNVHDNYINCITKYNECLFSYRNIIEKYPNYKSLFLLIPPYIKSEIERLSVRFDSVIILFDLYKKSCKELPQLKNVNDYRLNEIITYRLEGLTESNFTSPIVELWNFKSWAKNFMHIMNSEILAIRNGLIESDIMYEKQFQKLKNEVIYSDDHPYFIADYKLKNLIGKYDFTSISNKLLDYKESKTNYLLRSKSKSNDPFKIENFDFLNKLQFFREQSQINVKLNNMIDSFQDQITIESVSKYFDFYLQKYNGIDGLMRWCKTQKLDNEEIFNNDLRNLSIFHEIEINKFNFKDSTILFNKGSLAFGWQKDPVYESDTTAFVTKFFVPFQKKSVFLSGNEYKKGIVRPFVSLVNSNGKLDWLTSVTSNDLIGFNSKISNFQVLDDSLSMIISNIKNENINYTQKLVIDFNGKIVEKFNIDTLFQSVFFWADEINEQYFVILTDSKNTNDTTLHSQIKEFKIKLYDFNNNLLWQNLLKCNGKLIDVIQTNSNFFVFFNFTYLNAGNQLSTNEIELETPSIAGIYIDRVGKIRHLTLYKSTNDLNAVFCKKIVDNSINIFGIKGNSLSVKPEYFYLLTNNQGVPSFSNSKDLIVQSFRGNDR